MTLFEHHQKQLRQPTEGALMFMRQNSLLFKPVVGMGGSVNGFGGYSMGPAASTSTSTLAASNALKSVVGSTLTGSDDSGGDSGSGVSQPLVGMLQNGGMFGGGGDTAANGLHLLSRDFPRPEALFDLLRTPKEALLVFLNTDHQPPAAAAAGGKGGRGGGGGGKGTTSSSSGGGGGDRRLMAVVVYRDVVLVRADAWGR